MASFQVLPVNGFWENVFLNQELNFLGEVEDLSGGVEKVWLSQLLEETWEINGDLLAVGFDYNSIHLALLEVIDRDNPSEINVYNEWLWSSLAILTL